MDVRGFDPSLCAFILSSVYVCVLHTLNRSSFLSLSLYISIYLSIYLSIDLIYLFIDCGDIRPLLNVLRRAGKLPNQISPPPTPLSTLATATASAPSSTLTPALPSSTPSQIPQPRNISLKTSLTKNRAAMLQKASAQE